MRISIARLSLAAAGALALASGAHGQVPTTSALPAGPGHDAMIKTCSVCHSPEIAATQRLTPAGWDELVETMISRGAQASDADIAEIKAYLSRSFPDKPAPAASMSK